jgi:hypothetical protein
MLVTVTAPKLLSPVGYRVTELQQTPHCSLGSGLRLETPTVGTVSLPLRRAFGTMPSADFCLITSGVTPTRAIGLYLIRSPISIRTLEAGTY